MRTNLLVFAFSLLVTAVYGQHMMGFNSSNYAGLSGMATNPACIVDSRYRLEVNVLSTDFNLQNSFLGLEQNLFSLGDANPLNQSQYTNNFQMLRRDFFKEEDVKTFNTFINSRTMGPSAMFQLGKNAFSFTTEVRGLMNIDNVDTLFGKFLLDEANNRNYYNRVQFDNRNLTVQAATWSEIGLGYGREIFSKGSHYLSGAARAKILIPFNSFHFYADQLKLNFDSKDTVDILLSDVRFGYSDNLEGRKFKDFTNLQGDVFKNIGVGLDIGFVYEWRPKIADLINLRFKNKYLIKVGAAINDIGSINFNRGSRGGNFTGGYQNYNLDSLQTDSPEAFGRSISSILNMPTNQNPYSMRLPTNFTFSVDVNVFKWFYVNFTTVQPFDRKIAPQMLHGISYYTLTPRFESTWFDVLLPITLDQYNHFKAGFAFRAGPVSFGSDDLLNIIAQRYRYGSNFYMGLKVPIPFAAAKG